MTDPSPLPDPLPASDYSANAQAPKIAGQTALLERRRFGDHEYAFYRVPDVDRLVDEIDPETFAKDERMPYWAELWPSGLALASFLAASGSLRGVRMLELGCGLGLPSIVAARLGARATATDYSPEALELLEINAALNGVRVRTVTLDWRSPADVGRFDLVVAADVLYEHWQAERIVAVLGRTVLPTGHAILIDPDRLTAKDFASAAAFRGFRVRKREYSGEGATGSFVLYDLAWAQKRT